MQQLHKTLPITLRAEILVVVVYCAAKDVRSFSPIQGREFSHFCQKLVDVTLLKHEHPFDVNTVLPSKTKISSSIRSSADKLRQKILQEISGIIGGFGC